MRVPDRSRRFQASNSDRSRWQIRLAVVRLIVASWPKVSTSIASTSRSTAQLLADDLFDDALEGQAHRQAGNLLDDAQQLAAAGEQLVDLGTDGLGGRYSWCTGVGLLREWSALGGNLRQLRVSTGVRTTPRCPDQGPDAKMTSVSAGHQWWEWR
jgi:hypothetical protein